MQASFLVPFYRTRYFLFLDIEEKSVREIYNSCYAKNTNAVMKLIPELKETAIFDVKNREIMEVTT